MRMGLVAVLSAAVTAFALSFTQVSIAQRDCTAEVDDAIADALNTVEACLNSATDLEEARSCHEL